MDGEVARGFEQVADAFEGNFRVRGELGAAVAVHVHGQLVVDLADGRDPVLDRPFTRDTLMMVASCSKSAVATCAAMLIERGLLDPDARVAHYWPEFGQGGKQDVTVAMLLSHQAGLPYPDPGSGLVGMDQITGPALLHQLEVQPPWWTPGTAFAYHPVTFGALVGELVRRVTGQRFATWFAEQVAGPLGLDFWFGLPAGLDDRVAVSVWADGVDGIAQEAEGAVPPPDSFAARRLAAMAELPAMDPDPHDAQQRRAYYGADVPAAHGITNARSLARMLAATLGDVDGVRLISDDTRLLVTRSRTDGIPALIESGTAGPDIRFGLGYQLASGSMPGFGPSSYGHTGAGGRLAIADPDLDVSFGYVCNSMRMIGAGGDPRWQALIDSIRRCL